jgi:hypothetical protein
LIVDVIGHEKTVQMEFIEEDSDLTVSMMPGLYKSHMKIGMSFKQLKQPQCWNNIYFRQV